MHVVGTGLSVFGFWSLSAVGLFLAFSGLSSLRGRDSGIPLIPVAAAGRGWRRRAAIAVVLALLLVACVLVVMGVCGVAAVVY